MGDPSLLLFAGRFTPAKNVELVMEMFVEIAKCRGNVICRFFGNGPLEAELRGKIVDARLGSRIRVNGYVDNLWQWIANADVFTSMSAYEGQPNIILEAAVIGCPLVLSDIPAHREILGDQAAQYVSEFTIEAGTEKILSVLDNTDASQRRLKRAREAVEKYSVDLSAMRYRDLYEELLS